MDKNRERDMEKSKIKNIDWGSIVLGFTIMLLLLLGFILGFTSGM